MDCPWRAKVARNQEICRQLGHFPGFSYGVDFIIPVDVKMMKERFLHLSTFGHPLEPGFRL
jgi:hypothetical protein